MKTNKPRYSRGSDPRRRAEVDERRRKRQWTATGGGMNVHAMVDELEVGRIEPRVVVEAGVVVEPRAENEDLKRDLEIAKKALDRYTSLYDLAPVGLFTFDREGRILEVNATGAKLLGVERSHLLNKWLQPFVSQESIPVFNAFCKTVLETRARQTCEVGLLKKARPTSYARIEGSPHEDDRGGGEQWRAAIFDITEEKRAEQYQQIAQDGLDVWVLARTAELTKANEDLRSKISELEQMQEALQKEYSFRRGIIANLAEGLSVCHKTTEYPYVRFSIWNPRMAEITGWKMEEINSLGSIKALFPDPEVRESALARMDRIWEGDQLMSEEWTITRADGEERTVAISTSLIEHSDGLAHLLALMHDVTDLRRSQTALRESRRYFRSLLHNLNEDVLVIDRQYQISDVNKDCLVTLGRPRQEVIGRHCHVLLHGFSDPCSELGQDCMLEKVFETGLPSHCRHEHLKADGSSVWVDALYSPLKDETGNTTHVISTLRDVSHEMELEKQLRHAQKVEAIGTLAGGISHDFNNLLTPITIYTEMALYKLPQSSSLRRPLEEVLQSARHAKNLVKQILAFSRPAEEERHPLDISHMVKETVKLLHSVLPRSIEIRTPISVGDDGESGTILADPSQIHQVLMNLCTNAAHAMGDQGGILEVGLANVNHHSKSIPPLRGLKPGPYVRLTVSDTGCGMDDTVLERIFDPFFTTKGPSEGTGLGLAVAYGIVKSHGGEISVSSKPGKGTTFQVLFPRIEDDELQLPVEITGSAPCGTERILLVDDEEGVLGAMEEMLCRLGYDVTAEENSLEALETFRGQPDEFDLIITDQNMPHMTGVKLAREVREIDARVPIVICTGYNSESAGINSEMCRGLGIRELMLKPVTIRQVAESVRRVLDGRQTPSGSLSDNFLSLE